MRRYVFPLALGTASPIIISIQIPPSSSSSIRSTPPSPPQNGHHSSSALAPNAHHISLSGVRRSSTVIAPCAPYTFIAVPPQPQIKMEDIEHVFAGATNLLLVVEPCDKFPKGVYRAYAMRDGKPKSAYVMNPDERAGKGNVVKWTEIKKEHKYAKYDDIGYWLAWKRLVGVPKKRSREQLLHDWWHAVAEARQHGRVAPTLSSVIDTYVESKRPANDEGAAAQSSSMTKPEESVLPVRLPESWLFIR